MSSEADDDIPYVLPAEPGPVPFDFCAVPWQPRDLAVGLGVPVLVFVWVYLEKDWLQFTPSWLLGLVFLAAYLWMGVYPVWLGRRRLPESAWRWPDFREIVKEGTLTLLILPAWYLTIGAVLALWMLVTQQQPEESSLMRQAEQAGPHPVLIGMLIAAFTVAPVVEEIFCRGFLLNALRRFVPLPVAMVLQAVVFGLFHPLNAAYILATGTMGLLLGLFYERRKTLLAPMLLHGCHNFIVALTVAWVMIQTVDSPVLGISGDEVEEGFRITEVFPGYGAEQSRLQPGDVVVRMDDEPVRTLIDIRRITRTHQPGEQVRIHFLRNGEPHEVDAELRARGDP